MTTETQEGSNAPLWEVVPMEDFKLPSDTQLNAARKKWHSLRNLFRLSREPMEAYAKAEKDLRALPSVRLENLVPPIEWAEAATALDRFLATQRKTPRRKSEICFLIGQPHINHGAILREWAVSRQAMIREGPDTGVILSGERSAFEPWEAGEAGWVIPQLERWYLRHADGFWLARALLEQAARGRLGAGIIGCDSWAWAYLQRVWPIPNPRVMALRAFDGRQLAKYFMQLQQEPGVRFCNARTGEPLFSDADERGGVEHEVSRELRQLGAHCRGNVAIARQYWRKRLRTEPETDHARASDGADASPKQRAAADVVWLAPGIDAPILPIETGEDLIFILHTLLLHNGLPTTILAELLPLPKTQLISNLLRLQSIELVENNEDVWRISALGYPGVREFLRSHGYLVDAF